MNNKGVSMISVVVTVLLIIIIAAITSYCLSSIMEDVQYKDAKEELKNVETVVEYAKTQILIDEFMPNEDFIIDDAELDRKFGKVLSTEEIEYIKKINNSDDIKAPYKYYLMKQEKFDAEFGNDYNVSNLRPAREYLINYMDAVVISTYEGERIATVDDIKVPSGDGERAEIQIVYEPNGNIEWSKQQATMVFIRNNAAATIKSTKYLWSQSYTKPSVSEFTTNISDGQTVSLDGKTGNDWYLWVCVSYEEHGIAKTYITRSEPFYVDNTPPTADLEVEEIRK